MSESLRILVVEDHPIVRLGVTTVVNSQAAMHVSAVADTPERALTIVKDNCVDLVISALRLGEPFAGIELCRNIKSTVSSIPVLVYTSFDTDADMASAYLAGADSFVSKGVSPERLLSAIRRLSQGRRVWDSCAPDETSSAATLAETVETAGMTPREREILGLMLQRFSNQQIAEDLTIEITTVKTHVRRILQKLDRGSRQDLF